MSTLPLTHAEIKMIEQGQKQIDQRKRDERNTNMDRDLRKTGVMTSGPVEADYDYAGAYDARTNFGPQPDGGINFPNKFTKGLAVSGRDAATGELLVERNDPDGFGKAATKGIANSHSNSATGQPETDIDAMVYMAIEHMQNGGSEADFEGPYDPELIRKAFWIAESYNGVKQKMDSIDAINADPAEELVGYDDPNAIVITPRDEPLTPPALTKTVDVGGDAGEPMLPAAAEPVEVTQASMAQDATLQQSAQIIAQANNFEFEPDDDVTELLIEEMAFTMNNTAQMAKLVYAYEVGDMDDQTALAYAYALDQYMKLSAFNMDSFQGGLLGVALDPLTYVSGAVGKLAYSFLGKRAGVQAVIDKLSKGVIGKVAQGAAAGVVPGAVEAGVIVGGQEVVRQAVNQVEQGKGYDTDRIASEAGWGSLAGGIFGVVLGGMIGGLASKEGRDLVKAAYNTVADNWSKPSPMPGTRAAMRGSVGVPPTKPPLVPSDLPPVPFSHDDFGVFMAGNARYPDSFYSRLSRNISERWDKSFKGKESVSAKQFMQVLDSWAKKPLAQLEGFSKYEVENTGLRYWVQAKIAAKERVSKENVEDFLFANEPIVNVNVTGVGDDLAIKGNEYFIGGGHPRGSTYVRNKAIYALYADRLFEFIPGSEYTNEVQATKQLLDELGERIEGQLDLYDSRVINNERNIEMGLEEHPPVKPEVDAALLAAAPEFAAQMERYITGTIAAIKDPALAFPDKPVWEAPEVFKPTVRDKVTREVKTYNSEKEARRAIESQLRQITADVPTDQVILTAIKQDASIFYAPVRYQALSFGGEGANNNYREMRLYFGNDRRGNVQDLAVDRFGVPYDELSAAQKKRVDAMPAMRGRKQTIVEQKAHYPMEINRFGHIRFEDIYDADGNKVMGVLEIQSDAPRTAPAEMHPVRQAVMATAYDDAVQNFNDAAAEHYVPDALIQDITEAAATNRKDKLTGKTRDDFTDAAADMMGDFAPGAPMEGTMAAVRNRMRMTMGDEALENKPLMESIQQLFNEAPEIKDANWEMVEGVNTMLINRMLQYADEQGYKKMMIPFDTRSIEIAEGWKPGTAHEHPKTVARYQKSMEIMFNGDKKTRKRWGIKKLTKTQGYDDTGELLTKDNEMWLVEFEGGSAPKGTKALYSAGGPAYIAGESMKNEESE